MTATNLTATPLWVKPYADFPLSLHASGQLQKKIRGRTYYFGKADNWRDAVKRYDHDRPYRERGETPPPMPGASGGGSSPTTTDRLANLFIARELARYKRGEIGLESYTDTQRALGEFLMYFGRTRPATSIVPREWAEFRHWLRTYVEAESLVPDAPPPSSAANAQVVQKSRRRKPRGAIGPSTLKRRIKYIRACSTWASHPDNGIIHRPLRFGDEFGDVPLSELRAARNEKRRTNGKRSFLPAEIAMILDHLRALVADRKHSRQAKVMRAFFLLGLNGGYQQSDVSALTRPILDLDRALIDYNRLKTGVTRLVALWPRTVESLREAIAVRPDPREPAYADHVFLTRQRLPWVRSSEKQHETGEITPNRRDAIAEQFGKLLKSLGLKRPGLNFGAVRHTFYSAAGGAKDPEARNVIVGHTNKGMGEWYEQGEEEMIGRVRAVAAHVESRLFK